MARFCSELKGLCMDVWVFHEGEHDEFDIAV
jgi:hypothetical protein